MNRSICVFILGSALLLASTFSCSGLPVAVPKSDEATLARARTHLEKGRELLYGDRPDEAAAEFRRATALAPDLYEAHREYILLQDELGKTAEMEAEYRPFLERLRGTAPAHYLRALQTEDSEEERREFEEAIVQDPTFAPAVMGLGGYYYREEEYEKSLGYCRRAVDLDPSIARYRRGIALNLDHMGKGDEAIAEIRQAIARDPRDPEGYLCLSFISLGNDRFDECSEAATTGMTLDKRPLHQSTMLFSRYCARYSQGEMKLAREDLRQAASLARKSRSPAEALHTIGMGLTRLENEATALALLEDALMHQPKADLAEEIRADIAYLRLKKRKAIVGKIDPAVERARDERESALI